MKADYQIYLTNYYDRLPNIFSKKEKVTVNEIVIKIMTQKTAQIRIAIYYVSRKLSTRMNKLFTKNSYKTIT